ncbi:MAG: alpha/beta fold hydrolase [Geminocystis sp.]|nr:alpha/beta fold hydrolase [Geminocystis sp.]
MTTHLAMAFYTWKGLRVAYRCCLPANPTSRAVVFVHGFGANSGHWRHNLPVIGKHYNSYALDLLGFGASDKPSPRLIPYTFETWGKQLGDFCREVVQQPVILVANSIGCIVAMQTAVFYPQLVLNIAAFNCSLRLLHERKRKTLPWYKNWGALVLQRLLRNRWLGSYFYHFLARKEVIRELLLQAYQEKRAVDEELVELIYQPSQSPGAMDVFLAFINYSTGPIPEELLPILPCPITFFWGSLNPWEPVHLGRKLAEYPCVKDFIELEGLGHCPHDEAPQVVNPLLLEWLAKI